MPQGDGMHHIVCNVCEVDTCLRLGAKCTVILYGNCFKVRGRSRGGRTVEKFAPIHRFHNFRAVWTPDHEREGGEQYFLSKESLQPTCEVLEAQAQRERDAHPGRRGVVEKFVAHAHDRRPIEENNA